MDNLLCVACAFAIRNVRDVNGHPLVNHPDYSMTVDVVDQNNRPIGRAVRANLFAQRQNFRTVHVMLKNNLGDFLLQKLPLNHDRSPQRLGSSVAGYVRAGENYRRAAHRKLLAELGLHADLRWISVAKMKDGNSSKYIGVFEGIARQEPKFAPDEIEEILYLSPDSLRKLVLSSPESFTATFLFLYGKLRSKLF